METRFNPLLVALSFLVAIFASYVALHLAHSVTHSKDRARILWLAGGALAMGIGIWSMHFVGMLAFEMPGMTMAYDIPLMVLSILVAIVASGLALLIVSQPILFATSLIAGGIAMAAGIAGMHYIGMYSMRMNAVIHWNMYLVVLSIVIALVASLAALKILTELRDKSDRLLPTLLASLFMGIAIAGMHYTGMFAATFIHTENETIADTDLLVSSGLAIAVLGSTLIILMIALISSIGQRLISRFRRHSEKVLTTSEERYRLLIEAVKDYAIFLLDPNGLVTSWNSGAEKIIGYSAVEIIGQHYSTFYTKEDLDVNFPLEELRIAESLGHFETEGKRLRKDGSVFWANVVISPVFDTEKRLTSFSKVIRDISALKEAEWRMMRLNEDLEKRVQSRTLELQQRETQLRSITNALPVLLAQVDSKEHFLYANDMFCKWFGVENEKILGLSMRDIFGEERYAANHPYISQALAGSTTHYERLSVSQGQQMELSITFVPEFDDDNNVTSFVIVATDITKHKEIADELKKARDAADVANKTKSAFLANMSHEIRTPLGAVLGFSELMMNDDISPAERLNSIDVIQRNGQLLSNIINDILDLSKVEAGKLEIEKSEVLFSEVLREMGSLHRLEALEKGITLKIISEGVLPESIVTDPLRLRQILLNIIGNAIKFTEHGEVEVTVKMSPDLATGDNKLAFHVRDTGEGIAAEQAAKLFTPFTQADVSTTRKFGGTGLGLVLSKKLASALGGDIVLKESHPGKGSTFVVTIDSGTPKGSMATISKSITSPGSHEVPISLKHLKILLVDDSLENQILIKTYLTIAGATVETANNGREALEKALRSDYSLILMDLQMPEMDGYQATAELRKQSYLKPIIALTAHAMMEDRRRCLESGFNDHLTKPVERKTLLTTLAKYPA